MSHESRVGCARCQVEGELFVPFSVLPSQGVVSAMFGVCVAIATAPCRTFHISFVKNIDVPFSHLCILFLRCYRNVRIKAVESAPRGVSNEEVLGIRFRWGATVTSLCTEQWLRLW